MPGGVKRPALPARPAGPSAAVERVVDHALVYANQLAAPVGGPRASLEAVARMEPLARHTFASRARLDATFGKCPRSMRSWAAATRWWLSFAANVLKRPPFPIRAEDLQVASTLFRSRGTFANYCSHWRTAAELLSVPTDAFDERRVKRAKDAIVKRCPVAPKVKRYAQHALIADIVAASVHRDPTGGVPVDVAMMCIFAYAFLLRLPSEGLPAHFDGPEFDKTHHASLRLAEGRLDLRLSRRKNSERPVTLKRACWCAGGGCSALTCPVHVLGPWLEEQGPGAQPFRTYSPAAALAAIRAAVGAAGAERPREFDTKSFWRGHALDLVECGGGLAKVLEAGGWRSAAFIAYLPKDELEREAVLEAREDCSSESGDDAPAGA